MGRWLVAAGAILAALAVGLSAYAAHAASDSAHANLQSAALFALLHGIALAALGSRTPASSTALTALLMLFLGTLLFSGSLVAAHVFETRARLAPTGGVLLIAGWLLYALAAFRR